MSLDETDRTPSAAAVAESDAARAIALALANGRCPSDADFDRHLPRDLARLSSCFWTPVSVAYRVAAWLDELGARSALDVGSGAGKLCVVAALSGSTRWLGLEHRPHLVKSANELARRFSVGERVDFRVGELGAMPLPVVDAYYFFNPFGENLFGYVDCIDTDVVLGRERYALDVAHAEALLHAAPVGTAVVTYNGFGGRMPAAFVERRVDRELPCVLRLYEKVAPRPETYASSASMV